MKPGTRFNAAVQYPGGREEHVRLDVAEEQQEAQEAICPQCHSADLRFNDDIMTGLVYESCACGYRRRLCPQSARDRCQQEDREASAGCLPFVRPRQRHPNYRRHAA